MPPGSGKLNVHIAQLWADVRLSPTSEMARVNRVCCAVGIEREALCQVGNSLVDILALSRRQESIAHFAKNGRHVDSEVRGNQVVWLWLHAARTQSSGRCIRKIEELGACPSNRIFLDEGQAS